jgi:hypothetical protein
MRESFPRRGRSSEEPTQQRLLKAIVGGFFESRSTPDSWSLNVQTRSQRRKPGGNSLPKRHPKTEKSIMNPIFRVTVAIHPMPGFTPEQAKLRPGAFTRIFHKTVRAVFESEAEQFATERVDRAVRKANSNAEAYTFVCQAVRLKPATPVPKDFADLFRQQFALKPLRLENTWPETSSCRLCNGFGFVSNLRQNLLLCRCTICNRFESEENMFLFLFCKLTAVAPSSGVPPRRWRVRKKTSP